MSDVSRDPPAVQLGWSVVNTLRILAFVALAVGPLVAGFLVPLGPPQYHAEIAGVSPVGAAPPDAVDYDDLSPDSRSEFDSLLAASDNAVTRQVELDPEPTLLAPGETVVVRNGFAFRVAVTRSEPLLRPAALLVGVIGSILGTVVGATLLYRDQRFLDR